MKILILFGITILSTKVGDSPLSFSMDSMHKWRLLKYSFVCIESCHLASFQHKNSLQFWLKFDTAEVQSLNRVTKLYLHRKVGNSPFCIVLFSISNKDAQKNFLLFSKYSDSNIYWNLLELSSTRPFDRCSSRYWFYNGVGVFSTSSIVDVSYPVASDEGGRFITRLLTPTASRNRDFRK